MRHLATVSCVLRTPIPAFLPLLVLLLITGCGTSEEFTGFSYDPEGVTETETRDVRPMHRRTIGIASEDLWVGSEFEGARMSDFYKAGDSLYRVVIRPENAPINNSPWYAFRIWSSEKRELRLQLSYEDGEHRYLPELSRDGERWRRIEASRYETDTAEGTATLRLEVGPRPLWVSAQELDTYGRYASWADSLTGTAAVTRDTVGRSHLGKPVEKLTLDEVSGEAGKPAGVLVITARQHPPEVTGSMAFRAFFEELAGHSELARRFRARFAVWAYPFLNPDGTDRGHWRNNAGGVDLNRDWRPFNQPETQAVRDDLLPLAERRDLRVYYGIDFHSTDENIFYPIERQVETFPDDLTYRWTDAVTSSFPEIDFVIDPFDTSSPIMKNWIWRTFGADAVTYEVNDNADRGELRRVARTSARLLMEQLLEAWESRGS
ncbi:MAG: M14 family metallopeptidase [Balneolaceae bacterium]|nr:M14 family metallopeptidase [Balneolaceae bacterium]